MPLCVSYFSRALSDDVLRNHAHYCRLHGYAHAVVEASHIAHRALRTTYKYDQILSRLRQLDEGDWLFFIDEDTVILRSVPIERILGDLELVVVDSPPSDSHPPVPMTNLIIVRNTPANRALFHALMTQSCHVLTLEIEAVDERALLQPAGLLGCNQILGDVHVNVSSRMDNWEGAVVFAVCLASLPQMRADGRPYEFMAHDLNLQAFLVRQANGALIHGRPILQPASYPALSDEAMSTINPGKRVAIVSLYTHHIASYARVAEHNARRYCLRHGYSYHVYRAIPDALPSDINGTWVKTWLLLQHFDDHDWVIWVDADTLFFNQSKQLEPLLKDRDLLLAKDLGGWPVNAGVMGFRTTPKNRELLQRIWERITTVQDKTGIYSSMGDQYYVNEVLAQEQLIGPATVYDHLTINTPPHLATADTLLVHFVNMGEPRRSAYMADMDLASTRAG